MTSRKSLAHNRLPKDRILYCERCGISFLWSGEEQQLALRPTVEPQPKVDSEEDAGTNAGMGLETSEDESSVPPPYSGKIGTAKVPTHCAGCRTLMPAKDRERGIVKWYNPRKRFGFITREDGTEIYANGSRLQNVNRLRDDQLVEFRATQAHQGPAAIEIQVLELDELASDLEGEAAVDSKTESVAESIRQALSKSGQPRRHQNQGKQNQAGQSKDQGKQNQAGQSKRNDQKGNPPRRKPRKSKEPDAKPPNKKIQKKDSSKK